MPKPMFDKVANLRNKYQSTKTEPPQKLPKTIDHGDKQVTKIFKVEQAKIIDIKKEWCKKCIRDIYLELPNLKVQKPQFSFNEEL